MVRPNVDAGYIDAQHGFYKAKSKRRREVHAESHDSLPRMRVASKTVGAASSSDEPAVRRTIGPVQMAPYGLGSMLGSGDLRADQQGHGRAGNAV
ncbi:MAG: hypothetical protein WA717_12075 [Methyloceanibacter sp.]